MRSLALSLRRNCDRHQCAYPTIRAGCRVLSPGGWSFPLPEGKKSPPPDGCTGEDGVDADADQLRLWVAQNGRRNIGLRMPTTVIGIDVDNYDDKTGGADLGMLEAKLGELPPTFIATSREDGVSGIRFFTVPEG